MFGENKQEFYNGSMYPVDITLKYEESKKTALEIIDKYENINASDFWILKNFNKYKNKMGYTGLIISHNGCLKLNDEMPDDKKFRPECVTCDSNGYGNSLVYTYCCPDQGIYEVGEYSKANSQQAYPYAMAFKRLYDRVVLKNSRLAYGGIYSEVEADEFKEPQEQPEMTEEEKALEEEKMAPATDEEIARFKKQCGDLGVDYKAVWKNTGKVRDVSKAHLGLAQKWLVEFENATGTN